MNANELADCLDMRVVYGLPLKEAAAMLRQQQYEIDSLKTLRQQDAEIEALKKEIALQRLSDFTQDAERLKNES
jgi:hypothetical protein